MRLRQLAPTLLQLTRLRFVNAYLVREADGLTLVDSTVPRGAEALLAAVAAAGAPIRRIALTHGHGDHVGSLDELCGRLDGAEPAAAATRAIEPARPSRALLRPTRSAADALSD